MTVYVCGRMHKTRIEKLSGNKPGSDKSPASKTDLFCNSYSILGFCMGATGAVLQKSRNTL